MPGASCAGCSDRPLPDQQLVAAIVAHLPVAHLLGVVQRGAAFGLHDDDRVLGDLFLQGGMACIKSSVLLVRSANGGLRKMFTGFFGGIHAAIQR